MWKLKNKLEDIFEGFSDSGSLGNNKNKEGNEILKETELKKEDNEEKKLVIDYWFDQTYWE